MYCDELYISLNRMHVRTLSQINRLTQLNSRRCTDLVKYTNTSLLSSPKRIKSISISSPIYIKFISISSSYIHQVYINIVITYASIT